MAFSDLHFLLLSVDSPVTAARTVSALHRIPCYRPIEEWDGKTVKTIASNTILLILVSDSILGKKPVKRTPEKNSKNEAVAQKLLFAIIDLLQPGCDLVIVVRIMRERAVCAVLDFFRVA